MDFERYRCLSFDCYGTLIDWESGLLLSLRPLLNHHRVEVCDRELLELYAQHEAKIEAAEYRPYKEILREVLRELGESFDFSPTSDELENFSVSVKNWPPFADSGEALRALQTKYRLIILSNIDDDLIEYSAKLLDVDFDEIFTAQRIGAYKPSLRNFQYLIKNAGVPQDQVLHIAQSLFHDIAPAKQLGFSTVWVNRRKGIEGFGATLPAETEPDLEVPDMKKLAFLAGVI